MLVRHKIRITVHQMFLYGTGLVFTYVFPDGHCYALLERDKVATWKDLYNMACVKYF